MAVSARVAMRRLPQAQSNPRPRYDPRDLWAIRKATTDMVADTTNCASRRPVADWQETRDRCLHRGARRAYDGHRHSHGGRHGPDRERPRRARPPLREAERGD